MSEPVAGAGGWVMDARQLAREIVDAHEENEWYRTAEAITAALERAYAAGLVEARDPDGFEQDEPVPDRCACCRVRKTQRARVYCEVCRERCPNGPYQCSCGKMFIGG